MSVIKFDIVIIGTGPAGEGAAMHAVKDGKKVAVIEFKPQVGGNCTHLGTIPSKTLRHCVKQTLDFNLNPFFRNISDPKWINYSQILKQAEHVVQQQSLLRFNYYSSNRIKVFFGEAQIVDKHTVKVTAPKGNTDQLIADKIIIATGAKPYRPTDINFSHKNIFDSDTILTMDKTPRRMIIYGAGVVGCEYASIFSALGIKVDLINTRNRLLSFLDMEISDALSYQLRKGNVIIRHNEIYEKVITTDKSVTVKLKSGKSITADVLLWANGRTGDYDKLNLDNVGIKADKRGYIPVNKHYQTSCSNIYAVGDIIGWPSLASAANAQGRSVAAYINGTKNWLYVSEIPTGIYTIPEISSLGYTEEQLTQEAIPYEVGKAFFSNIARAQITGEVVGMLKILFHRETLKILGIHCFGDQASEIIHIGHIAMSATGKSNNINCFVSTTFNYPTMAEAYRIAALDGLNRINN
jgi:NAD(P) transhydrogenase